MRPALILAALAPLLMAQAGDRAMPRAHCGFGEGLAPLREVEREAALPVAGVSEGRARGERFVAALNAAAAAFRGCGCSRLAELTAEAAAVAASAPSEASVARLSAVFGQVRFRARLAREFSEERACR